MRNLPTNLALMGDNIAIATSSAFFFKLMAQLTAEEGPDAGIAAGCLAGLVVSRFVFALSERAQQEVGVQAQHREQLKMLILGGLMASFQENKRTFTFSSMLLGTVLVSDAATAIRLTKDMAKSFMSKLPCWRNNPAQEEAAAPANR